jgi:hypothetical protein
MGPGYTDHASRFKSLLDEFTAIRLVDFNPSSNTYRIHNFAKRQWSDKARKQDTDRQFTDSLPTAGRASLSDNLQVSKGLSSNSETKKQGTEAEADNLKAFSPYKSPSFSGDEFFEHFLFRVADLRESLQRRTSHRLVTTQSRTRADYSDHIQTICGVWSQTPGCMRHKQFTSADHDAALRAIKALRNGHSDISPVVSTICDAIRHYGEFCTNAAGEYRKAYRWTFYEFITRNRFNNLQRFSSPTWADTCREFKRPDAAPRSVSSLISRLDRLR